MSSPSTKEPFTEPLKPLPKPTALNGKEGVKKPAPVEPRVEPPVKPRVEPAPTTKRVLRTELIEDLPTPTTQLALPPEEPKKSRWLFWKRRDRRDEQLHTLRQGAAEMVGLMRSIRSHLEAERTQREGLNKSLSPLPVAVKSLENISRTHNMTGQMLTELKSSMERTAEKDGFLIKSLDRIGSTMSNVDETFARMGQTLGHIDKSNQTSLQTMQQLGQRVEDSDRFMSETFARLRDAEHEFTDYVGRASRRSTFAMVSVCSMLLLAILAVGFMFKENRALIAAMQPNGPLVVQSQPVTQVPQEVAMFDELNEREDGIDEPDREIVQEPFAEPAALDPVDDANLEESLFRVSLEKESFLSINELPKRK